MKKCGIALFLALSGCTPSGDLKVVEYKTVSGSASAPWPSGCLVTIENRTQRFTGLYGLPCDHIQIGDKAVFHKQGDTVFWINDIGYNVQSASAR
jgi:hypothetical protein